MAARNAVFCPVWNQNPDKDTLYICHGEAFQFGKQVLIEAIQNVSLYGLGNEPIPQQLTENGCNSAFPSTNREGNLLQLTFNCPIDYESKVNKLEQLYSWGIHDTCCRRYKK